MSPRWLIAIATAAFLMIIISIGIDAGTITDADSTTVWGKLTYFQYVNFTDPLGGSNFFIAIAQDAWAVGSIVVNFIVAFFYILTWNYNFLNAAGVLGFIIRGLFTAISIGVFYSLFREMRQTYSGS